MTLDHDLAPWRNVGSRPCALPGVGAYRVGPKVTVRSLRKTLHRVKEQGREEHGLGRGSEGWWKSEVVRSEGTRETEGGVGGGEGGEGGKEMEGGSHRGFRWRVHVRVKRCRSLDILIFYFNCNITL